MVAWSKTAGVSPAIQAVERTNRESNIPAGGGQRPTHPHSTHSTGGVCVCPTEISKTAPAQKNVCVDDNF